ncbi:MAG TPA: 1,2-phenylacetyl-CoA epoxidase subunit PaaC [Anaerolineae bacterium]
MNSEVKRALRDRIVALADDEMILAHRHSEWAGHGPILEEDIAFANIALDEMGHASTWYGLLPALTGEDPDQMVFFREAGDYRCVQMVVLPKGDWAFSMLRQYLFDGAEMVQLGHLADSAYRPLAEAAAKIRTEEIYHLRHTSQWVRRLGLGTEESNWRLQRALDELWPYAQQLFVPLPDEGLLVEARIVKETAVLHDEWQQVVRHHLEESGLRVPDNRPPVSSRTEHTEHLPPLLEEMQIVARLDPEAEW